jgi:hypothetical protein
MKTAKPFLLIIFLVVSFLSLGFPLNKYELKFKEEKLTHKPVQKATPKNHTAQKKKLDFIGPTQPEVQTFKPSDANNLVDLFTGDFSYNIPLMDVGGYPINLFYNSNISMEDEASWVGLGWNINPGVINRNVRGLPDDFSGEEITRKNSLKPHLTIGGSLGANVELFGFALGQSAGVKYNNYTGLGLDLGAGFGTSFSISNATKDDLSAHFGLSSDGGASASISLASSQKKGFELGWNSLEGINSIYVSPSYFRAFSSIDPYGLSSISFARQTYTPSFPSPMKNYSGSFKVRLGGEIQGVNPSASLSGYFSYQELAHEEQKNKAFGYLYAQSAEGNSDALYDFNREEDRPFEIKHPDLPVTNFTYDVYAVSGEGISGSFRPFRSDVGTLSDPVSDNTNFSAGVGLDLAAGLIAKIGFDIEVTAANTYSGPWKGQNNTLKTNFRFSKPSQNKTYEPVYFKNVGEKNVVMNNSYDTSVGKRIPLRAELDNINILDTKTGTDLKALDGSSIKVAPSNSIRQIKENRNINFQYLTIKDALVAANEPLLKVYTSNTDESFDTIERGRRKIGANEITFKEQQISEITVLKDDGTRYVYGLPAYNYIKKEVSFNISRGIDPETSDKAIVMNYTAGKDNSTANENGTNHMFSSVATPAYAYAYYITAILSPDYVDVTGDGPSSEDLGNYTKFSYFRNALYRWRSPQHKDSAFINAGNLYDQNDDMAQYVYGEKEVFYLRNIETKNYVAICKLSDRRDAHGVKDENGETDYASSLKRLDSILLYTKSGYLKGKKVPIKKVHFEYDYSLCKNNPSTENGGGKLTLKRVYFTYQRSSKGQKSNHAFSYNGLNPDYALGASDRWGTYKAVKSRTPKPSGGIEEKDRLISNSKFPYTDQDHRRTQADAFAAAWMLTDIKLPTGGKIGVQYEADDYAYVQDKRAMQMLRVLGFAIDTNGTPTNLLYASPLMPTPHLYVHVQTTQPITDNNKLELLQGIQDIYFQAKVNITNPVMGAVGKKYFESVEGYFQLWDTGAITLIPAKPYEVILRVKPASGLYHPVTLATLKRIRKDFPGVAYKFPEINEDPLGNLVNAFVGLAKSATDLFAGGLYNRLILEGVAREIETNETFVRLNVPNKIKVGGGSRVKTINISDEWGQLTSGKDSTKNYSTEYSYTRQEGNSLISSGVASYEPALGRNENPFVVPEYYSSGKTIAFQFLTLKLDLFDIDNEQKYVTGPFGESFFPGPSVGYSKVTVRKNPNPEVKKHGTGKTEHGFYTAFDFPTIYKRTDVSLKEVKLFLPFPFLNGNVERASASQGYYIEVNDMHGKPKSVFVYRESDSLHPISGKTYFYKQENGLLNNTAKVIDRGGSIHDAEIGNESDMIVDERESESFVGTPGFGVNIDILLAGIIPVFVPSFYPSASIEDIRFRSICITKVAQRSGLLDSMVSFDNGARMVSKPVLYDAITGNELLAVSNNEFNDSLYTLNIPAHWVYEGMGPAFYNYGVEVSSFANGTVAVSNFKELFHEGDELLLRRWSQAQKAWVLSVNQNSVQLIDTAGAAITNIPNGSSLKILRSGRRNMQSISLGQVVMMKNPVQGNQLVLNSSKNIINAQAEAYTEHWQTYAGFKAHPKQVVCDCSGTNRAEDSLRKLFAGELLNAIVSRFSNGDSITGTYYAIPFAKTQLIKYFHLEADSICFTTRKSGGSTIIDFVNCLNQQRICTASLTTNDLGRLVFTPEQLYDIRPDNLPNHYCAPNSFAIRGNTMTVTGEFECLALKTCHLKYTSMDKDTAQCSVSGYKDEIVNPFLLGLKGNYRPLKSLLYVTERTAGQHARNAGTYTSFEPYWTSTVIHGANPSNWTWTTQHTKIDPYGRIVETKDTLGRYSADLYGFNYNFVTASARNARYQQIGFISFEDYDYKNTDNSTCWLPRHFAIDHLADTFVSENMSHTGRRSLKINAHDSFSIKRLANDIPSGTSSINNGVYTLRGSEMIGTFNPLTGHYYIEAWVKVPVDTLPSYVGYTEMEVVKDLNPLVKFKPFGPVVEGWQKIGGLFALKDNDKTIQVRLINMHAADIYYDDIRIHPMNAVLQTYVYDPQTLRLMATLDENNFATLYEYDEEGQLTRTKKETQHGILTLQEVRAARPQ